jgi:serine/threonine protein phosphatase PrpC
MELLAEEMIDLALIKGSRDNISAVVVKLPGAKIGPECGGVLKRRGQREKSHEEVSKEDSRN